MSRYTEWFKRSYVYAILMLIYIPLFFAAVYSLSKSGGRGQDMPLDFLYTGEGWSDLFKDKQIAGAIWTTIAIASLTILIVVIVSLLTVYALWKQKSKSVKGFVSATYNVPLINPDIITAIMIALMYSTIFGVQSTGTGFLKVVMAQVTMILPFGITIMYPKSEKFSINLMEASKDLGYGPVRTWFKTYFIHMLPVIASTIVVAFVLSADDFIITRTIYSAEKPTVGTLMYQGKLEPWILAIGTIMLIITLTATAFATSNVYLKEKKLKIK